MSFLFVFAFLSLIFALSYLASISKPLEFDQTLLPKYVSQLAQEAYLEGRIVMSKNDKRQIESFAGKPWSELDYYSLNSIWLTEIDRLKELSKNNVFFD